MSFLLAALVVVVFAAVLEGLDLPDRAREVGLRSRESLDALRDPSLDDREKEEALQAHSLRLFALLGILLGGSVLALGLPLGGVWLLDRAGAASFPRVLETLSRVDFLVGATVVGLLAWSVYRKVGGP